MPEWIKDPQVWIAVGTLTALILSQLPPLRLLLKRPTIQMTSFTRLGLYHALGNPNCYMFLMIENTGGRMVSIERLTLELKPERGPALALPANGYWSEFGKTEFPIVEIYLKPGDRWANFVHFFEEFDREDERLNREIVSAIKADITSQQLMNPGPRQIFEATEANVDRVMAFFEKKFRYKIGEYVVTLRVQARPASASTDKRYRMTLYESDVETLRGYSAGYKYGSGVYFQPQEGQVLSVVLSTI